MVDIFIDFLASRFRSVLALIRVDALDDALAGMSLGPLSAWQLRILTTAEFAKQMLQMPGIVHSSPPLTADAFQMAKADNDFQQSFLSLAISASSERC